MKSFYKIHTLHRTWEDAKDKCNMEGATLFYPDDDDEVNAILKFWNETQPFAWVFVGISTPNVKQVFETVDGEYFFLIGKFMFIYKNTSIIWF